MAAFHGLEVLLRFTRLIASASQPSEVLELLADAAVRHFDIDAAAVLEVFSDGHARIVATEGCGSLHGLEMAAETIGHDLRREFMRLTHGAFGELRALPLIAEGDLFGVLVLLSRAKAFDEIALSVVGGLVDVGAASLAKAFQHEKLRHAHQHLKESHDVLARTEKLRALGEMSAGISHDLRNIFSPILLQVELLKRKGGDAERVKNAADRLERVAKRGLDFVDRLRLFSKQAPETAIEVVDLNPLVDEAIELSRPRIIRAVPPIRLDLESGHPPSVSLHASEFVAATLNLIVNAVDAMPEGGTLGVKTGERSDGAWVRVADTGVGMSSEVQRRLFEPFFTTKGKEGTGLGLAMVYSFVERHRGNVRVESAAGKGTAISMWFPKAAAVESPVLGASTGDLRFEIGASASSAEAHSGSLANVRDLS